MSFTFTRDTASEVETRDLGERMAAGLRGGEIVALSGPLGAGKTSFVRGLARGLHVSDDELVASPTFVLLRTYHGRLVLHHVDVYRLSDPGELDSFGFDELCEEAGAVVVVEWADRVADRLSGVVHRVSIAYGPSGTRRITVESPSEFVRACLETADPAAENRSERA